MSYTHSVFFLKTLILTAIILSTIGNDNQKTPKPGQVLKEPTIESVAEFIKSGNCKKVIFMVGAGISTCKFVGFLLHNFINY